MATLKYMNRLNPKEVFPVGTQFALIEQAFLISDKGELILSPLIVSISLRAFLDVNLGRRTARPAATQCVAEFVLQPRQLMQGNAVMKALHPREHRYEAGEGFFPPDQGDPFETGDHLKHRLNSCMSCHGGAGLRSMQSRGFETRHSLKEGSPESISEVTSKKKRNHGTWKTLHGLWGANSKR